MSKLFGDKAFRKTLVAILIPIVVQNTFTNLVNLLDNIMVGRIGTEAMTGVSVANLLFFVFNLAIFGIMSGAGIYGAQYAGKKDWEGVRKSFRYKIWAGLLIALCFTAVLLWKGTELLRLYMTDDGTFDVEETLRLGRSYMLIIIIQMFPAVFVNAYATTLRECGETKLPMMAGIAAVGVNFVFNLLLIFGLLGFPKLGVQGAAIATVLARFSELFILIFVTKKRQARYPFAQGLFSRLTVPLKDALAITGQGLPLMINETLWSLGNTFMIQFYSTRGLLVVAALNITSTVNNLFMVSVISFGSAVAIILGQLLGAGKTEEAKEKDRYLISTALMTGFGVAALMSCAAPFIPLIYNTTPEVQALATKFLWVCAAYLIADSFFNVCYFTLRSGGNTLITIVFDCGFLWAVTVPWCYFLAYKTSLPILLFYPLSMAPNLLKIVLGSVLLKKSNWAKSLVNNQDTECIEENGYVD